MLNEELKSNTLVIPKGLHAYEKVEQLFKYNNDATILYKSLNFDLINVEFYTQTYCIVYSCSGVETITSYDFKEVIIRENELLFLPKDMHLISDFIKKDKTLEAFLFFFNDDVIEKFLSLKKLKKNIVHDKVSFYKIDVNSSVCEYMKSLKQVSKNQFHSKYFLELKLLELLCIIDSTDAENKLANSFLSRNIDKNKRNIKSLMKKYFLSNLTLNDYAVLSGRSLSTFHRDFKRYNDITPKQYLLDLKLEYAYDLLNNSDTSVSEISYEIGYENVSHFIKAFKKKYNTTPKQLSKKAI
jgi:AraC family transcriptional regulator, exoenzyme S synthesis regulatory protein ExsA